MKNDRRVRERTLAFLLIFFLFCGMAPQYAFAANTVEDAKEAFFQQLRYSLEMIQRGVGNILHPTRYVAGSLAYCSIDDLLKESTLIAIGKVTGQSESFRVCHAMASEGGQVFTDFYFTVSDVLKGEPYDQTVAVRLNGGRIGNYTEIYEGTPELNQEDEYLLFLTDIKLGGAFETEEDYYRVKGLEQGAYVLDSQGVYRNISTGSQLPDQVFTSPYLDEVLDEDYFRERQLEIYKENYETGFIAKEEYEECVKGIDMYGKKME